MRITLIKDDGKFYVNGRALDIDLSSVPDYVRAMQWQDDRGHIELYEFSGEYLPNYSITALPDWATTLASTWEAKRIEIDNPPPPPAETTISFTTFCRRVKAEGLWDKFSDFMRTGTVRNRIWDEWRAIRDPVPKSSPQVRNILADPAVGATQAQIDRIML